ncbi:GNAT family N-acetyltransferase [Cohnella pontilimi]|uniref:GNAT family N-acetyltransferase n=1 Tax=Cohnella pontilimi TaxID=2564100 RepID=A0A4U0FG38_9BACL|nr:GNAT family N-acetyltransferase [Cohnella pontilimi]TJY43877.1 GNAT family N-acetyltransferase [Cohnella pontilimi]
MSQQLSSSRLLELKVVDESYADKVLEFVVRNKQFLKEWEPLRNPTFYYLEAQRQLLIDDRLSMERGNLFKVWMFKKDQPDQIIGSATLSNIVRGAFQSCHLGYRIDQFEQNKGYMTEAVGLLVRYAFELLKLHRIEANIMPRNKGSLRVVEKLGFQHEGLARKYLKINGKWEDHIHMVLLNEELET